MSIALRDNGRGAKELILFAKLISTDGQRPSIRLLVDSGCTHSMVPAGVARRYRLPLQRMRNPVRAGIADGSSYLIRNETFVTFQVGPYQTSLLMHVGQGNGGLGWEMLLGMDWLTRVNPKINWSPLSMKVIHSDGKEYELTSENRPVGVSGGGQTCGCPRHGGRAHRRDQRHGDHDLRSDGLYHPGGRARQGADRAGGVCRPRGGQIGVGGRAFTLRVAYGQPIRSSAHILAVEEGDACMCSGVKEEADSAATGQWVDPAQLLLGRPLSGPAKARNKASGDQKEDSSVKLGAKKNSRIKLLPQMEVKSSPGKYALFR